MNFDELPPLGLGDAANYFHEWRNQYGTITLSVPAVGTLQIDDIAVAPTPRTLEESMEWLDVVHGISQMLQGNFWWESGNMRLGSRQPQSSNVIVCLLPEADINSVCVQNLKPVYPVGYYPCWLPPELITIEKVDSAKELVTPPALPEELRGKLVCLMSYLTKKLFVYQFCCVSTFLILETEWWDTIICLRICKGGTHHVKVLKS